MPRSLSIVVLGLALVACEENGPVRPGPAAAAPVVAPSPARGAARNVLDLREDGAVMRVTATVTNATSRDLLLQEIARRWPDRTLNADVSIDEGAPGLWLPEAMALMPMLAQAGDAGLTVVAEEGQAGGGTLTLRGVVADEASRASLGADASATVAAPFVVRNEVTVGVVPDTPTGTASSQPDVQADDAGSEAAAAALRAALDGAALPFESGSATPSPDAAPALDAAAAVLSAHPAVRATIAGPGEGSASGSLERELSVRRAQAVVDALASRGVARARLGVSRPEAVPSVVVLNLRSDE